MIDLDRFKRWMGLRSLYLKAVLPLRFPSILNIEPTNRCNLACTMCPRSISGRPVADMDWPLFQKIRDELAGVGPILKIFLQKDGEPLLHPRIIDMVRDLRTANAARNISIITNGTALTKTVFGELAQGGLTDLIVSIDAATPESYETLKGVPLFHRVTENVKEAARLKKKHGWTFPQIKARMVSRKGHEAEVEEFRRQWTGIADLVDITPFHTWIGAVRDERTYQSQHRYPCSLLWYTGVINADGNVSPCCIDFDQKGVLGDVRNGSFAAVWNGPALNRLRRAHLRGAYDRTAICGPCEYWLIKENIGTWLRRKYRSEPL